MTLFGGELQRFQNPYHGHTQTAFLIPFSSLTLIDRLIFESQNYICMEALLFADVEESMTNELSDIERVYLGFIAPHRCFFRTE